MGLARRAAFARRACRAAEAVSEDRAAANGRPSRSKRCAPWRWRAARPASSSTPRGRTAATRWSLGEARFHTCLEAEALGIGLLLPGHFASERFAMEGLAEVLARQFPDVQVWASQRESDPVRWG